MSTKVVERLEAGRKESLPFIARVSEFVTAAALILMMIITIADAAARSLFGVSLEISEEYGGYFLVLITFSAIPVAFARSSFHQVEFLTGRLSAMGRSVLQTIFLVLSLATSVGVTWKLIQFESLSFASGSQAETLLATPLWIPQLAMPVGMTIFCWLMAAELIRRIKSIFRKSTASSEGASR